MKIFPKWFFFSHHVPPIEVISTSDIRREKDLTGRPATPIQVTEREMSRILEACNWWTDKILTDILQLSEQDKKVVEKRIEKLESDPWAE